MTEMDDYTGGVPSSDAGKILLGEAKIRLLMMQEAEHQAGFAAPEDGPLDALLRTAMCALGSAIDTREWEVAAEALAMLLDYEKRVRGCFR